MSLREEIEQRLQKTRLLRYLEGLPVRQLMSREAIEATSVIIRKFQPSDVAKMMNSTFYMTGQTKQGLLRLRDGYPEFWAEVLKQVDNKNGILDKLEKPNVF